MAMTTMWTQGLGSIDMYAQAPEMGDVAGDGKKSGCLS